MVNYHTAYFSLVRRAGLKTGQTVLVHGAGGGLGQATVQVAKALGGRVLVHDADWVARVREITGEHGVDVLVDPVGGGRRFLDSLRLLAAEGRAVVVRFASGEIPEIKVNRPLLQNISVVGAAWREFVEREPGYGQTMARELNTMFNARMLHPPVTTSVPIEQSAEALRDIIGDRFVGRISIHMPAEWN